MMKMNNTFTCLVTTTLLLFLGCCLTIAADATRLNDPTKKRRHRFLQNTSQVVQKLPVTGHGASSIVNPNYAGYAVDGDPNTRWESARTDAQWIYVRLAQAYEITSVVIEWEDAYADEYEIQVSNDTTSSWITAKTVTNGNGDTDTVDLSLSQSFFAQFVRVNCTNRANGIWGFSIFELEVWGVLRDGFDPLPPVVLTANSADASSVQDDNNDASNAIDGDLSTRWASDPNVVDDDPQWIYVDLGNKHELNEIVFEWDDDDYATEYVVEVSDDLNFWFQRAQITDGAGGTESISLPPDTTGRFVRMFATSSSSNGYSLLEFVCKGQTAILLDAPRATIVDATASSIEQGTNYTPSLVFDGDFITPSSRWSSDRTDDEWIEVELDQTYTINQVVLYWESAWAARYIIQSKVNPNDPWTDRFTQENGQGGVESISFVGNDRAARFIRMLGLERATIWGYSLLEIVVEGPSTSTDPISTPPPGTTTPPSTPPPTPSPTPLPPTLAPSSPPANFLPLVNAQASSVEIENFGENVPNKTIDGDPATRWASQRENDTEWIYVEFDKNYRVLEVELDWEEAFGRQYEIQVSDDASSWTTVYTETNGDGGVDTFSLDTTPRGNYLRMLGIEKGIAQYGYSLWEFRVRGDQGQDTDPTPTTPPPTPAGSTAIPVTLAIFNASASSVESQDNGQNTADKAIDGDFATRWASGRNNDIEWIYVDLGTSKLLTDVELYWEDAFAEAYDMQVSNTTTQDDSSSSPWTTVYSETNGQGGNETFGLAANTYARYLRMYGTQKGLTQFGYSLYEVVVKGL